MKNDRTLGLYLHIPFCLQKCLYCDFCSYPGRTAAEMNAYAAALETELSSMAEAARDRWVSSVFFGGGTPTLLPAAAMARLCDAIRQNYRVRPDAEWTLEGNPATFDERRAAELRACGFNRISIGLQSACDAELRALGRVHTAADGIRALRAARAGGFTDINADIMFGIPGETVASFAATLDAVLSEGPEHLSVYSLQIEEGTPFYAAQERLSLPDEDAEAAMYEALCRRTRAAGYRHYEISNFARTGHECRHNLRYWRCGDYLGFGVAAHSLFADVRFFNRADMAAYLAAPLSLREEEERVGAAEAEYEAVMLALRLAEGVNERAFFARFGHSFRAKYGARLSPFRRAGLVEYAGASTRLTERGMRLSNAVLAEILGD